MDGAPSSILYILQIVQPYTTFSILVYIIKYMINIFNVKWWASNAMDKKNKSCKHQKLKLLEHDAVQGKGKGRK